MVTEILLPRIIQVPILTEAQRKTEKFMDHKRDQTRLQSN